MYEERLKNLRDKMAELNIDYYYVPAADAHRNEYVPDCWQRRAWITGFTGSAGDALIGKDHALLWTDGRYFLQAEQQLDPNCFQLMKQQPGTPSIQAWLTQQGTKQRVGVDPKLLTLKQQQEWTAALHKSNSELLAIDENWIDLLWNDQPQVPTTPLLILENRYAGRKIQDKLSDLRQQLVAKKAEAIVITRLDAIAWLFNMRGNDITYNPLSICYAIITPKSAILFIDPKKVTHEVTSNLNRQGMTFEDYDAFGTALNNLKSTVLMDPNETSWWTAKQLKNAKSLLATSPITLMKAIKNPIEQKGMREAHRIDAIAMTKFLHWIETHWQKGVTEIDAANQLEQFRREDPRCKDLSFPTISGFGSHGAIIHYFVTQKTNKMIDDTTLYLVDSGGQYFEGTTDVTRTIHLGQPTLEEKTHYTLVLKGHLALGHTTFSADTFGEAIDVYARQPLQEAGYDYPHGTGHGVGCYLCVHEGPQAISPRKTNIPLQAGMVVSNEPGLYLEGQYGIRIENVCLINEMQNRSFTFEDLTLVPYARKLINMELLNLKEITWINAYHEMIYHQLASKLSPTVLEWLKEATKPLKSNR